MKCLFSVLALLFVTLPFSGECADEVAAKFQAANQDYQNGKYADAAGKYSELTEAGKLSPELYYNLGASYYQSGETGNATLWMRRALVLDPAMPEAKQSLAFLRSHTGYLEFAESGFDRFVRQFPESFWKWLISIFIWAGLLSLAVGFFVERLKPNRSGLITLAILCGLASLVISRISSYRERNLSITNFATIVADASSAQTAPTPGSKSVIDLPPGSEVRILQKSGNWCYAEIPGEVRGWIRTDSLEPVWPLPSKNS
ncbi:MAG: hypothetical protein CMO55_00375 [Verrucomicrobiales bacterium]|nr:hypothetical protein [Verrucomicrobiales bacterium]